MKILFEYVWIDGKEQLRSKNRIIDVIDIVNAVSVNVDTVPIWNFDGSSTYQANTKKSDIILKPVRIYKNPFFNAITSYLVLCECYNSEFSPHSSNTRFKCVETSDKYKSEECLFGIEQEYTFFEIKRENNCDYYENVKLPYLWKNSDNPGLGGQGPYYCSIGGDRAFGRPIVDKHLSYCLTAGIDICGTNAEVMASQWEYQIGVCSALKVSDDLWMSRYILQRITEEFDCYATFHPKPYEGWNGTGGHTNFSTNKMREENGIQSIYSACEKLRSKHSEHIEVYGKYNDLRLCGQYETSDIDSFSCGVGDRSCSIRIPINVYNDKCGYLEDRRPASNLDPYLVTEILIRTICE